MGDEHGLLRSRRDFSGDGCQAAATGPSCIISNPEMIFRKPGRKGGRWDSLAAFRQPPFFPLIVFESQNML